MTEHEKNLICGIFADTYVVMADEKTARELAKVWQALDTAKTWAEVREIMPEAYFNEIWQLIAEDVNQGGEPLPDMAKAFDPVELPGYMDGDWPAWPAASMLDWVPKSIQARYGKTVATRLNGDFLEIAPEHLEAVIQELENLGYHCRRDDELIAKICGQGQW